MLADYERRSLAHVVGLPEQLDAPGLWRGVGYRIGSRRLASGFDEVLEILPMPPVTPVPGAQPWMLGVANVRGNLLPIVDLKQFLEGERTVLHEGQRVLLVRQPGGDVAVLIDELFGQRSFTEQQLTRIRADRRRAPRRRPLRPFHRPGLPPGRTPVGCLQPGTAGPHARIPTSRGLRPATSPPPQPQHT